MLFQLSLLVKSMNKDKIKIINADITKLDVDAIVNAANQALCGGGGVDGAIHRAAGPELLDVCKTLGGCNTGLAKRTPGFNLAASHIIHTVGPVWYGGHKNEEDLLASCYLETLKLASIHNVKSIAFPAISTGAYRFPIEKACDIAIKTIVEYLSSDNQLEQVLLVCFDAKIERQYQKLLVIK